MAKSIIIKCTIGGIDISNDSIDNFKIDRNFADVSNPFSMSLIDSPVVNSLFTDIELYMCAGGRSISLRYGDDLNNLESFSGTIWDYRVTFVGDIKKLEISGYLTPSLFRQNVSGSNYVYNIDWNSYYNLRADNTKMWNVLRQLDRSNGLANKYRTFMNKISDNAFDAELDGMYTIYGEYEGSAVDAAVQSSDILDDFFHSLYTFNTTYVTVQGPVGVINLPVPTSFVSSNSTEVVGKDKDSGKTYNFEQQAAFRFYGASDVIYKYYSYSDHKWHKVSSDKVDSGDRIYYIFPNFDTNRIIGFKSQEGTYVEVNLGESYAGAGIQLYNSNGVSPSDIVRQLAILEGWEIGNIVDTDTVPCGDTFKMNGKSALQFINENLVPVSILPTGMVKTNKGTSVVIPAGSGGFNPYFKDGKFYYEPVSASQLNDITSNLMLGYNLPNSPVLSFQIDTKGTVFYTVQPIKMSTMNLVTGKDIDSVATTSVGQIDAFNKVSGFNEGLASFFGLSYDEAKSQGFRISTKNATKSTITLIGETNPYDTMDQPFTFTNPQLVINSSYYDDKLVSTLASSAVSSNAEVIGSLESAKRSIKDYMLKATMTLWGDIRLKPASLIRVTNMIKSRDKYLPEQHFSSGTYIIQKQTDELSGSGFIQTLNLLKYSQALESSLSALSEVDWSSSKVVPLTSDLKFIQKDTQKGVPSGYKLLTGVTYTMNDTKYNVYSNGTNIVNLNGIYELDLNTLSNTKTNRKLMADVAIMSDLNVTPPKGYTKLTEGFYGDGKTKADSKNFYTPFYGGIYFMLNDWDNRQYKMASQYTDQFYVSGTNTKFYIKGLFYQPKYIGGKECTPDESVNFFYEGAGPLKRR